MRLDQKWPIGLCLVIASGWVGFLGGCVKPLPAAPPAPLPTSTPTPTGFVYENFDDTESPNPNGNCWAINNPCSMGATDAAQANLVAADECSSSITLSLNTNTAYVRTAPNSEKVSLTFNSLTSGTCGSAVASWGISSEYSSQGCGGYLTIPAADTTMTSTVSYWIYPITQDGNPFTFETAIDAGSGLSFYQGLTGSNVITSVPSGQWTQVVFTLSALAWSPALPANGTAWNVNYIETWGIRSSGPTPYSVTAYVDQYVFNP